MGWGRVEHGGSVQPSAIGPVAGGSECGVTRPPKRGTPSAQRSGRRRDLGAWSRLGDVLRSGRPLRPSDQRAVFVLPGRGRRLEPFKRPRISGGISPTGPPDSWRADRRGCLGRRQTAADERVNWTPQGMPNAGDEGFPGIRATVRPRLVVSSRLAVLSEPWACFTRP
jgi:hypothetical protein